MRPGCPNARLWPWRGTSQRHLTIWQVPRAVPRSLSVQPTIGDLVDAELPRSDRVPLPYGEQEQSWLRSGHADREDRTPTPGRLRDVELDATTKPGTVAGFGVAWTECTNRHTVRQKILDRLLDRGPRRLGRMDKILYQDFVIDFKIEARASRPVSDAYPSPSGGFISGPYSCQNFSDSSGVIAFVPVRLRISSIEVALEGQSGA